jgi:serine phosphatase RsbU (regulator of sigma subunit)
MLRYASCGHPPAILVAEGDSVRKLGATAAAFGMFQDLAPEVRSVALGPGDALLLYSDGLPEAQSSQGEELGESGLLAVVLELLEEETLAASAFPRRVIDDIIEGRGFQQRDDMTLVLLRGL